MGQFVWMRGKVWGTGPVHTLCCMSATNKLMYEKPWICGGTN